MIISHNMSALNTQRQFKTNSRNKGKSVEKLTSGYKINRASDDAAGLTISEKMRWQIRGLSRGTQNCEEAVSLCQVADGAMSEVHEMLQRMNELCIQAANDTNTDEDREAIDQEVEEIKKEIDRVGNETLFNEIKVLQGNATPIGYRTETREKIVIDYVTEKRQQTITEKEIQLQEQEVEKITYLQVTGYTNIENPYISDFFPGVACNTLYPFDNVKGSIYESQQIGQYDYRNAQYYNIDFSKIDEQSDWEKLDGAAFSFICIQGCEQVFSFYLDNSQSGVIDMTPDIIVDYRYTGPTNSKTFLIGTANYTCGADMVSDIREYVKTLKKMAQGYYNTSVGHDLQIETTTGSDIIAIGHHTPANAYGGFIMGVPDLYTETTTVLEEVEVEVEVTKTIEVDVVVPKERIEFYDVQVPIYEMKDIFIQHGAKANEYFKIQLPHIDCDALKLKDACVLSRNQATKSIEMINNAISMVSDERSRIGAYTNGLEHLIANQNNIIENTQAAESRIRDADMAEEMVKVSICNILEEAGYSLMAQANQNNASVVELLRVYSV